MDMYGSASAQWWRGQCCLQSTPVWQQCTGQPRRVRPAPLPQFHITFLLWEFLRYGETLSQKSNGTRHSDVQGTLTSKRPFYSSVLHLCSSEPAASTLHHTSAWLCPHAFVLLNSAFLTNLCSLFPSALPVHSHLHTIHLATPRITLKMFRTLVLYVVRWPD